MLSPGTHVEHYEILSAIGHGGMGEVYRAHDNKLGRDVAFKVVRDAFAGPEGLSRFQREAKLLALLNHPNIAQIYGVATAGGVDAIVMELVEGETLHARLARAALPLDEAIPVARQIAEALEVAHERGIVHRDLKPGNIMLTTDGSVKVLDFGLAKALAPAAADVDLSHSPTVLTSIHTEANALLGTAAYMSPEQVRGRVADERSDIWAFGCVLYEMLTGQQPFTGETATDIMGGVLRIEPDWKVAPAVIPAPIRSVIQRCLQKDRRQRYHAIGDARHDLLAAASRPAVEAGTQTLKRRERIAWGAAAVFAVTALGVPVLTSYFSARPAAPIASQFLIEFPPETTLGPTAVDPFPTVSPDGRYVAFRGVIAGGFRWWLRPIGSLTAQQITGTAGTVLATGYPFWSHDGRYLAFFAENKLKKVAVDGGPPQILCDAAGFSGTWNQDDVILFEHQRSLHRVSAAGGVSTVLRQPDQSRNEVGYSWPAFLPDGRHFVYVAVSSEAGRSELRVGALDSNDDRPLFAVNSRTLFARPNHLLFVRDGMLMAQPFDAGRLELAGSMFPVAEGVAFAMTTGAAAFGVSNNGTLVYRQGSSTSPTELTWVDRSGNRVGVIKTTGFLSFPAVSPDQRRVVIEKRDAAGVDLWVVDVARGTNSRFTFDPAEDRYPQFSPDGTRIAFASNRDGGWGLYVKAASGVGAEELLQKISGTGLGVSDWSPDQKTLLYNVGSPDSGWDTWALPLAGERKPYPVLNQKYNELKTRFSPDGKWILYTSNETGRDEIYVQAFPPVGGKWQLSVDGGNFAYWRRDGKEILFDSPDRKMMAVDVQLGATFQAGVPRVLFPIPGAVAGLRIGMMPDAQQFLLPIASQSGERPVMRAVLNWTADLKH